MLVFFHTWICVHICSPLWLTWQLFVNLVPSTVAMYVTTILDPLPQIGKALLAYTELTSLYVFVEYSKQCRKHV